MAWVATAIIGGAIIGGIASNNAADTVADANASSAQLQDRQYQQDRQDTAPWREAGARALAQQEDFNSESSYQQYLDSQNPDNFKNTDYYKFLESEGTRARDRSASSRGMLLSGGQQRAITAFGQGLASTEYGNYFERQRSLRRDRGNELASIASTGMTATNALGQRGSNYAANAGNAIVGAGNAQGAGILGVGNAINTGINQWALNSGSSGGGGTTFGSAGNSTYGYNVGGYSDAAGSL